MVGRYFDTGAYRDTDDNKNDYEGCFCPLVIEEFGNYMKKNRLQPDGSIRLDDNWQKGIPKEQYVKSLFRHYHQLWKLHRGHETKDEKGNILTEEEAACGVMFNVMGYLHEILKEEKRIVYVGDSNHEATEEDIQKGMEFLKDPLLTNEQIKKFLEDSTFKSADEYYLYKIKDIELCGCHIEIDKDCEDPYLLDKRTGEKIFITNTFQQNKIEEAKSWDELASHCERAGTDQTGSVGEMNFDINYISKELLSMISGTVASKEEQFIKDYIKNNLELVYFEGKDGIECRIDYKYPEGTFMWATEQMKQGKKVRRKTHIDKDFYIYADSSILRMRSHSSYSPGMGSIQATDWEIYKESCTVCTTLDNPHDYRRTATIVTNDKDICKKISKNPDLKLKVVVDD